MIKNKIAIIGAGNIGSTLAHIIMINQIADVAMFDVDSDIVKGKSIDIMQSKSLFASSVKFSLENDYKNLSRAKIIVVTAGVPRKPGMSREDLVDINANVIKEVGIKIKKYADKDSIVIVVTNPLDIMTWVMYKTTGFSKNRIIGMAGILDTSRFVYFLSEELKVDVSDIQAMVLGGHGDAMLPLISYCNVAGIPLKDYVTKNILTEQKLNDIIDRTKNGGAEIVSYLKTGSAYYAPASSIYQMVVSIFNDSNKVLPCSTYLEGEYGLSDIFIGVPVTLNLQGRNKVINLDLTNDEKKQLYKSADVIKEITSKISII